MFDRDMRYIAASRRWIEAFLPGVHDPVGRWTAQALLFGRRIEGQLVDIERIDGTRGTLLFSAAPLQGEGGASDGA